MKCCAPGRQSLLAVALTILLFTVAAPHCVAVAQTAGEVEMTVHLGAVASRDEAPTGDVTIEFTEASTRVPVASYTVEGAAEELSFQVTVPATEVRSGWFASARTEGWWSSTAYIAPDDLEVSLALVPEGVVRFAIDGTDRGVDRLRTGHVWIAGRVGNRGVRLERGLYGGPCEVDREPAGTRRVDSNGNTDGSGVAPHWLPMEAEIVDVVVRADGLGMVGWRFEIRDDAPIEVEMSPDRGALRVPDSWAAWLVTPGGALVDVGDTLAAIADRGQVRLDGDEFVVGDLAPGTYSYCLPEGVCTRVDIVPWAESRVRE